MINYNKVSKFANIKYSLKESYHKNKIKIYLLVFIIALSVFTGILTAVKLTDLEKILKYAEFSFEALMEGGIYKFSFLLRRMLSVVLVMALLWLFSVNKFLRLFGFLLIGYRGFLLSLNVTLIVMHLGVGGIINGIVIIFPCQLIQLLILCVMFLMLIVMYKQKQKMGKINQTFIKNIIWIIILSALVCFIEWLILLIFKATTILIIWLLWFFADIM